MIFFSIDKSQGQTLKKRNIFESARFIHGQLYIAASTIRSLHGLRFYISEYNGQGHLANDERVFIKNYRLQRSFESLIKLSTYVCQSSMGRILLLAWFFI